jgi:hypothetical protein
VKIVNNLELELIILKKEPYNEQRGHACTTTSRKRKLQRLVKTHIFLLQVITPL